MTELILMIGVNVAAWVALVCAALWQQRSDRTPPAEAGVSLVALPVSARGRK